MAWKELSVAQWRDELSSGLEYRRRYGREQNWGELEALYSNVSDSQKNDGPNIIFSTGDALLSTLTTPTPYITIDPVLPQDVDGSPILETVDNLLVGILDLPQEVEDAALATYLFGRGFLKIGYDSEWGWSPKFDVMNPNDPIGITPTQIDVKGNRIEFNDFNAGMPWAKSVLPHDIVVPWGVRKLSEAPWVAHRVIRHIDDIKADPKYENKRDLNPNVTMQDFVKSYQAPLQPFRFGTDQTRGVSGLYGAGAFGNTNYGLDAEYVELWEIHDQRTGRIKVLATGYEKWLRNDHNLLAVNGVPFVTLSFNANARNFWVTSDAEYLRYAQAELTDIARQTSKQRRISIMKLLYKRGAISQVALDRLLSSTVGAGIEIESSEPNLDAVVKTFQPVQNMQLYSEAEETRSNAQETVGFSRNQFGQFDDSSRRTATEVNTVQGNSTLRMTRRQTEIRNLYSNMFKKMNAILFDLWKAPRVAQVLDRNGVAKWQQFQMDKLRGLYKYSVGFSPSQTETRESREQQALQLWQLTMQDPTVDPIAARRYVAAAFNDPRFSAIFKPGILEGDQRAAVPIQMLQQQMQQGSGGVQAGVPTPQASPMRGMPPRLAS